MQFKRWMAALAAAGLFCGSLGITAAAREEYDPWADEDRSSFVLDEEAGKDLQEEDPEKEKGKPGQTAPAEGTPQALLDEVELSPSSCRSSQLQELVDSILDEIIEEDMDTYEKVKACYDYVASTVTYGSHMRNLGAAVGDTTCAQIYADYGEIEGFGAVALSAKTGMCNAYASAFLLLIRPLGLNGHLVAGQTGRAGGGYAYHEWAEIDLNEESYLFDPQLEQDLTAAGLPAYMVFCRTYDEVPGRYLISYRK
ncbi:MAG: transglutaminase domain-containing protein [Provencibacterium sp.]|jgi:transglutaminase-like putative cysteine protease|nr:transglutaminase domain-containing protein [Provencibacterium sp.]